MSAVPTFNRGFRMRRDDVRGAWVVLAPERLFVLDAHAAEVLQLVDGRRSVEEIAAALAERFAAPVGEILGDVEGMLADLRGKGVVGFDPRGPGLRLPPSPDPLPPAGEGF